MKNIDIFIKRVFPLAKAVFSLTVIFSMLSMSAAPLAYAGQPFATVSVTTLGNPCMGTPLTINGSGTIDPAGQISQYKIQIVWSSTDIQEEIPITLTNASSPYTYTFSAGPKTYTGTPPATVTVKIYHSRSSGGDAQADSFTTVPTCPPNNPPTLSGVPATVTIPELALYTFTATAVDTDIPVQTLLFSLVGAPTGASINSSTGEFTWTPTEAQGPGSYPFTVRVTDGLGNVDAPITITVDEVNELPVAQDKTLAVNEDTSDDVTLLATDVDLPAQTLTYSIVANAINGLVTLLGNIATYMPYPNFSGSDSFTYKVHDGSGYSNTATVGVTVAPLNDAPVFNAVSGQTIPELAPFSLFILASDVDGPTLTYSITAGDPSASISSSTGEFTWTPTEAQGPGVYPFTIEVSDGSATDSVVFNINVTEVNVAPVLDPIGNQSGTEDSPLTFTVTGSDVDLPAQTLTITDGGLPTGATFDGATFSWTPDFTQAGNYSVTFTISDGSLIDSEIVPIDIGNVNRTPTLNSIGDKTVNEGNTVLFTVSGSDPDGGTLTYSAIGLPTGATFDTGTGAFSWTTDFEDAGVYPVTFIVSDGTNQDEETINITVVDVNRAPVAYDKSLTVDEDTSDDVTLTGSDVDLPAQTLTFSLSSLPTNGTANLSGDVVTYTPNANYFGSDSFKYVVNDGTTNSAEATVSVTVTSVNDVPVITLNGSSNVAVTEGNTYTEDGAMCTDIEDGTIVVVINGTVDTNTVDQYVLTYNCEDQDDATASVTRTVDVQATPPACMDGNDNDQDGQTDYPSDPGCTSPTDNDEVDPVVYACSDDVDNDSDGKTDYPADPGCSSADDNDETDPVVSGGGGSSGSYARCADGKDNDGDGLIDTQDPGCHSDGDASNSASYVASDSDEQDGLVLGAFTGPAVLGESMCGEYITEYIKVGAKNDKANVSRLQTFLNKYMGLALAVDGVYGPKTFKAVKQFQEKESSEVLNPWIGITLKSPIGTGWVYKTTKRWINMIECPKLNTPPIDRSQLF